MAVRYLDNQLTREEATRFVTKLASDRGSRDALLDVCFQLAMISESPRDCIRSLLEGGEEERIDDKRRIDGETVREACCSESSDVQFPPQAPTAYPALGLAPSGLAGSVTYLSSGWPVAYLVATVIFAIGLTISAIVHVSRPELVAGRDSAGVSLNSRSPSPNGSPIVARITGMIDCVFNNDECRMLNAELQTQKTDIHHSSFITQHSLIHLGDTLALRSGLLELTYDAGARVILQGPVTYEVESPAGGYLSLGRLTARLEKKSESVNQQSEIRSHMSFAVRTPTAVVTDLGTEFGVEVSREGRTVSHVFRGTIEVRAVPDGGAPAGRTAVLRENEAVCVSRDAGNNNEPCAITRTKVEPSRFTRALSESKSQEFLAGDAYAEYVLSLKPAVYYRVESPQKSDDLWTLYDFAGGGHHGALHCDRAFLPPPYLDGRHGKSLLFRGPAVMDHVIVPDYPKTADGRLTVSAWVKVTSGPVRWAMIASNWGDDTYTGQFHLGMHRFDGDLAANVTQRDGRTVLVREGESYPLPRGDWQHVAFVADGEALRLYRNGVEVASARCAGIDPQTPVAALGIGCKTNDAGTDVAVDTPAYWSGRIDELAVFNRALSDREIKTLYEGFRNATSGKERSLNRAGDR
jgi:hypothetical protein